MVSLQKVQGILVGYILYTVYTDNNPLRYLDTAKLGAVEQRWAAQLPAFNLTLKYRPGSRNGNADAYLCVFSLRLLLFQVVPG